MNVGTIYKCADVRPCYKKRKLEVWRKPLSNKESIACISKTGLGGHDGSRERLMRWWPKLSWEKQAHDESWCVYQPRMWRWKVVLIIIMVLVLVVAVEFPWNVMPKEKVTSYCCARKSGFIAAQNVCRMNVRIPPTIWMQANVVGNGSQ